MKNILRITKRDFKKIFTNSMAIILVVGLSLLPSLYAWFNIYNNWDPYGNTGRMKVAVINNDEGAEIKGIPLDIGSQIITNLKSNDSIDWQFVSQDEGLEGVKAGKYYAGIEIPEGFSKSFTSILTSDFKRPEITYYANEKKNAIATKITDKVVQTVQTEVNESFVTTVVDLINQMFGTIIEESDNLNSGMFGTLQDELDQAKSSVIALQSTLTSFDKVMGLISNLDTSINSKDLKSLLNNTNDVINDTSDVIKVTQASVDSISSTIDKGFTDTAASLKEAAEIIKKTNGEVTESSKIVLNQALEYCADAKVKIEDLANILTELNNSLTQPIDLITTLVNNLNDASKQLDTVIADINAILNGNFSGRVDEVANKILTISNTMSTSGSDFKQNIQPKLKETITSLLGTMADLSNVITGLDKDSPEINKVVSALNQSVEAGDSMMDSVNTLISTFLGQLDDLSDKIDKLSDSDIVNAVVNITTQNGGDLGEFLACPVIVNTDKVYGIETYGSAMAPFYSTLALWVGGTILVAIVKVDVKKKKEFHNLKPTHEYFGRGLTFVLIAMIQGLIICLGDLFFLQIQCYHPIKFIFAGVLGSAVMTFLIYSFAYTLGDIGKALAIIMLVVQIGGAGGTFPIDVTPQFFISINPYLPFTFVIEAMRECVCGTYGNYYWICLLKLLAYVVVALVFGLLLKRIVKKPIKFFTKRIEETDLF